MMQKPLHLQVKDMSSFINTMRANQMPNSTLNEYIERDLIYITQLASIYELDAQNYRNQYRNQIHVKLMKGGEKVIKNGI